MDLLGQWVGRLEGTNRGFVTLNLEPDNGLGGRALFTDDNISLGCTCARVRLQLSEQRLSGELYDFLVFDPRTSRLDTKEKLQDSFPDVRFPKAGRINGIVEGSTFRGSWATDIGTGGEFTLYQSRGGQLPPDSGQTVSWDYFKTQ